MTLQIEIFTHENAVFLKHAYDIRKAVFVEEEKRDIYLEFDGLDEQAVHFLVLIEGKPVATLRYVEEKENIHISRLAVLRDYRKLGVLNLLFKYALSELKDAKKSITINSITAIVDYYKRLGFEVVGEPYQIFGKDHQKMILKNSKK